MALWGRIVGTVAVATLAAMPAAAPAQIMITRGDVEAMSRMEWLEMKRNTPLATSERVQRFTQCIAYSLIDTLPEEYQDLDWEIVVFDVDRFNAFAQHDGKIGVFTGLFDIADTPDKVAAVLGHELAHVTENHVIERVRRGRLSGAAAAIGSSVTGTNTSGMTDVVLALPYAREQEADADIVGMSYMARAGYNPVAAMEIWKTMFDEERARRERGPEWLQTHPGSETRMNEIARNLSPALVEYNQALDAGVRPRCSP